jgi:hypothetical protein
MDYKKMNLDNFESSEVIELYSEIIKTLKSRGIIRTNNLVGDLGEYLVVDYFCKTPNLPNLSLAEAGTENIDAISKKGERYSIKSTSGKTTGVFYGLNPLGNEKVDEVKFEYVIIVIFNEVYQMEKIIQLDWGQFLSFKSWHSRMNAWNLNITKKLIDESKLIYSRSS